jgi:hypothetical protein
LVSSPLFPEAAIAFSRHFEDLFAPVAIPAGTAVKHDDRKQPVFIIAREAKQGEPIVPGMEVYLEPSKVLRSVPVGGRVYRRDRVG